MNARDTAKIIAMVAAIDHRVPPLATTGPDERVPVWQMVLADLDYATCEQGILELARDPGMITIRPGDVYRAAKRVMRRNLAAVDIDTIEPPDDMTTRQYLDWRRALIRAVGRGTPVAEATTEADQHAGVTRRTLGPAQPRSIRALIEGAVQKRAQESQEVAQD